MASRWKSVIRKIPKREREFRLISNPLSSKSRLSSVRSREQASNRFGDDYQAPSSPGLLGPTSKWLIVRNNIHKIRSWGGIRRSSSNDIHFQDWYSFFQMRRELRHAREHIANVQNIPHFDPVHYFHLPVDETHERIYNVSHVQPNDGLYYAGIGSEPIVLQYLLYYFSEQCAVPYNSVFRPFLSDVSSVLDTNRKRLNRMAVFRKMALITALVVFIIIGLMFFSLILGVLTTTSRLNQMYRNDPDGGIEWRQPETRLTASNEYL